MQLVVATHLTCPVRCVQKREGETTGGEQIYSRTFQRHKEIKEREGCTLFNLHRIYSNKLMKSILQVKCCSDILNSVCVSQILAPHLDLQTQAGEHQTHSLFNENYSKLHVIHFYQVSYPLGNHVSYPFKSSLQDRNTSTDKSGNSIATFASAVQQR